MTKAEFLQGLKSALENELDDYSVQEHVQYYDRYISDEVRNGTAEADVLAMLGDPWAIAKNILVAPGTSYDNGYGEYSNVTMPAEDGYYQEDGQNRQSHSRVHVYQTNSKWKIWAIFAAIILVIFVIFGLVLGIINLLAPILIPVLVIMLVFRLFDKKK